MPPDIDDSLLDEETKARAEEEAKMMVQARLNQQKEMARRMKVRRYSHLQAISSVSHYETIDVN